MAQSRKFVEVLENHLRRMGGKREGGVGKGGVLALSEVTGKQYEGVNIFDLLENIAILESRLGEELTVQLVTTLMALYQKTIEYYSALNDPAYDDFMDRLHILLSREDVGILLQSREEKEEEGGGGRKEEGGGRKEEGKEEEEEEEKKE